MMSKQSNSTYHFVQLLSHAKIGIGLTCLSVLITSCGTEKSALTPEQITASSKSGVVSVLAKHTAEISYPDPQEDPDKMQQLKARLRPADGQNSSRREAATLFLKEFFGNPLAYTRPGKMVQSRTTLLGEGTGLIVTKDGIVATAAHIVSPGSDTLKQEFRQRSIQEVIQTVCKNAIAAFVRDDRLEDLITPNTSAEEIRTTCFNGFAKYYAEYLKVNPLSTEISIVLPASSPAQSSKVISGEVKKLGQLAPGEDIALLKISGNDFPTLALADDPPPSPSSSVYLLSYPAETTKAADPKNHSNLPEPTLTQGLISASSRPGDKVLLTSIEIRPGMYGSPLLNGNGRVIGVASLTSKQQGDNIFVPVQKLKQFLQEIAATPT